MFSQERKYGRLSADVSHQQPRQPPHHASLRGHHSNHSLAHLCAKVLHSQHYLSPYAVQRVPDQK